MNRKNEENLAEIIEILRQLNDENQRIFINELHKIEAAEQVDTSKKLISKKKKQIIEN